MVMAILIIPLVTLRMMIQLQLITVEFVDLVLNLYLSPSGPNDDKQYSINDNTCEYYTNEDNQSFRSKPFSVLKRKKDDRMNEYLNIIKPLNINFPLSLYRRLGLTLVLRKGGGFLQPLPLSFFFQQRFCFWFVLFCFVLTAFFEQ